MFWMQCTHHLSIIYRQMDGRELSYKPVYRMHAIVIQWDPIWKLYDCKIIIKAYEFLLRTIVEQ